MKKLVLTFSLLALALPTLADTKVVAFMRHTFRGITKTVGPQCVALPEYGINIAIPNLSYVDDATPRGLAIARDFAPSALESATATAVDALLEHQNFDGRFDRIDTDFATHRTYWTALYLRDGLRSLHASNSGTVVAGCKTEPLKPVDVASARGPVTQCLHEHLAALLASSPDLARFKSQAERFLELTRSAIGISEPVCELPDPVYSPNGSLPDAYAQVASLASILEMSAALGAPLSKIFPGASDQFGKEVVSAGVNTLGMRFFTGNPGAIADATSVHQLRFVDAQPEGSRTVVLTHDDVISNLLRSLSFLSSESSPDEWGIYPMETVIIAISDAHASVVRMRLNVNNDGYISGQFSHKLLWQGTRDEWNLKVLAVENNAQSFEVLEQARACLDALEICQRDELDVRY